MFKQTQIDPCIVIVGLHSIQQTCFGQQWLDHTPHVCLEERIDLLKQILIVHDLRMFPWSLSPRFDENQGKMIMKSDPGTSPIIKGTWSPLPTTFLWREMDEMGSSHFIVPSFSEDEKTPRLPRHRLMVIQILMATTWFQPAFWSTPRCLQCKALLFDCCKAPV
jgi:hypothetical protein